MGTELAGSAPSLPEDIVSGWIRAALPFPCHPLDPSDLTMAGRCTAAATSVHACSCRDEYPAARSPVRVARSAVPAHPRPNSRASSPRRYSSLCEPLLSQALDNLKIMAILHRHL